MSDCALRLANLTLLLLRVVLLLTACVMTGSAAGDTIVGVQLMLLVGVGEGMIVLCRGTFPHWTHRASSKVLQSAWLGTFVVPVGKCPLGRCILAINDRNGRLEAFFFSVATKFMTFRSFLIQFLHKAYM